MNYLDVYYRALRSYRALTTENRDCAAFRRAMVAANPEQDQLVVTRNVCTVDEDWIVAIEEGLIFIEKAIREERQFIYSNGEVVPIEKVKHITKDSVKHLARHSNLITKEQTGDDIIPDQLYNVERLNDYAVYENRFLYMLLCYLRDFITIRYDKILELVNRYDGVLCMKKSISLPGQKITYTVDLHEERKNDKYLRENNPAKEVIDRIELILKSVTAFLSTPLMEIAGKAPEIKPPITKTNVLKMDNNFKHAVALYDYIVAYDKLGYTHEAKRIELTPFEDTLADELSEAGALLSFLTYEYGMGLNQQLKNNYAIEEARRKVEQIKQGEAQLEALQKRLRGMEITPDEYILALEKQVKLMQSETHQLEPLRLRIVEMKRKEDALMETISELEKGNDALREEMANVEFRHAEELAEVRLGHAKELEEVRTRHAEEVSAMRDQLQAEISRLNSMILDARQEAKLQADRSVALEEQNEAMQQELLAAGARIMALRLLKGERFDAEAFMEQEEFDELERELDAFISFYGDRWDQVKKRIRKKLLNYQALKQKRN